VPTRPQLLDCDNVSKLRQAVAEKDMCSLSSIPFTEISVGGLVELCCANHIWRELDDQIGITAFDRIAVAIPALKTTYDRLLNAIHDPKHFQLRPTTDAFAVTAVARKDAFADRSWSEFQQSFVAVVKSAGFQPGFAVALSAAFGEIVENVPDHSASAASEMAAAIIGYCATPGELHFAVGDVGRGLLSSLRENPRWATLENSRQAIHATLLHAATRKVEHNEGTGFKLTLKSFVDRNGILSVSSGDAVARVGSDSEGRRVVSGFAPSLQGTRVAATCFITGVPTENGIPQLSI
jgi:hypothetical protein